LVGGELQEGIVFVVAQDDVVARPVLAHHVGLEHQRLELVVGDDVLEVADLADQRVGLGIARARLLEVRAHAAPQGGGLADVEYLLLAVPVQVDAGLVGHPGELVFEEAHLSCSLRSALTRSLSSAAPSKSRRLAASFMRASSSPLRAWSAAGDSNVSAAFSSTGTV